VRPENNSLCFFKRTDKQHVCLSFCRSFQEITTKKSMWCLDLACLCSLQGDGFRGRIPFDFFLYIPKLIFQCKLIQNHDGNQKMLLRLLAASKCTLLLCFFRYMNKRPWMFVFASSKTNTHCVVCLTFASVCDLAVGI
jgi:hypothetical protein